MMKTIKYLSLMYFFWGMASAMVFTLLPIFIVEDLHGTMSQFGFIEGLVVFLSFLSKLCVGFLIDIYRKRIKILYIGTISTIISKILVACSGSLLFVIIAKSIDRLAKGLRHAPVDAIFASLTNKKGYIYSYRYSINIAGSFTGSLLTSLLVLQFGHQFRIIFVLACIPTIIAYYILRNKITYKDENYTPIIKRSNWRVSHIRYLPKEYWEFLILVALMMLNRFSEGFITLKAKSILPASQLSHIPLYIGIYELFIVITAIPMGLLSDKINKYIVILFGLISLITADIFGIFANSNISLIMIYILCGIHMGATHGILSSIIAKIAPVELIGTAFALYYGTDGIVLLIANNLAGSIGQVINRYTNLPITSGPFIMGTITTTIAIVYTSILIRRHNNRLTEA